MSYWKCRKCGTINSDMVQYCTGCRKSNGGCTCSCLVVIVTLVAAAAMTFMAFTAAKKHIEGKKPDGGTGTRTEVRAEEKTEEE